MQSRDPITRAFPAPGPLPTSEPALAAAVPAAHTAPFPIDKLPDDVIDLFIRTMPLAAAVRLGQASRFWRAQSRTRPELQQARLHPLIDAGETAAVARLLNDRALGLHVRIDERDAHGGMAPLLCAASDGHLQEIWYLLEAGASLAQKDDAGLTCLDWAGLNGHTEVLAYPKKCRAKHGTQPKRQISSPLPSWVTCRYCVSICICILRLSPRCEMVGQPCSARHDMRWSRRPRSVCLSRRAQTSSR